jgi:hypothetical protein
VSLGKLVKRVRREAKTNPKKAAVLGLLFVVALYFWAPLVSGWLGKDKGPNAAAPAPGAAKPAFESSGGGAISTPTSPSTLAPEASAKPKELQSPQHPWQTLVEWREKDPRTRPGGQLVLDRDPFVPPESKQVETKPKELPKVLEPEVTLQGLNLMFAGTIVGPGRRVARINGTSYEQGKDIELAAKDGKRQFTFTLVEVDARRIVLQRQGKKNVVDLDPARPAGKVEMLGSVK